MIRGRVVGRVWSTKNIETIPNGALLEVESEGGGTVVALDIIGCAEGEAVLVTQGSVAASHFPNVKAPIDALIIGSIDE
ncbi:MAG: hypothetical protein OXI87_20995 [Albidovulum sp.]|nr:hypothetical protein [Albidovulum sp.]MDE0307332.1 hypothetical protein [Albidovulum sp.]MDE0531695.1 hypothetical protein [Albidovulum sp.]